MKAPRINRSGWSQFAIINAATLAVSFFLLIGSYKWIEYSAQNTFLSFLNKKAGIILDHIKSGENGLQLENDLHAMKTFSAIPVRMMILNDELKVVSSTTAENRFVPEAYRRDILEKGTYRGITAREIYLGGVLIHQGKTYYWLISGKDLSGQKFLEGLMPVMLLFAGMLWSSFALISLWYIMKVAGVNEKINFTLVEFSKNKLGENLIAESKEVPVDTEFMGEAINTIIKRVETWQQSQRNFIHFASHELRTPLTIMIAQAELAAAEPENSPAQRSFLKKQLQELRILSGFTESLLLLSNVERADDRNRSFASVRVDELLYRSIGFYQNLYPDKTIEVQFGMIPEDESALMVQGIESLLITAFSNLLANAVQYGLSEKVLVKISCSNRQVMLEFINDGPVIPESERNMLFTPFYKSPNTKGLGLGLSLTKNILMMHKGNIQYHSDTEQRNVFTVTLK